MAAAALAWETVSGMSFGPWQTPERKMPAVGLSTGRSLGWASVKKSLVSMLAVSMVASVPGGLVRLNRRRQDDQVRVDVQLFIGQQVGGLDHQLAVRPGGDLADHALDVMHAVLLHRAAVELVEVLAGGADVDVEDIHIGVRIFLADQHGVLGGVHAADLRAVGLAAAGGVAGADALHKDDGVRVLAVGGAQQRAARWGRPRSSAAQTQGR